jgi:hypothetical protein
MALLPPGSVVQFLAVECSVWNLTWHTPAAFPRLPGTSWGCSSDPNVPMKGGGHPTTSKEKCLLRPNATWGIKYQGVTTEGEGQGRRLCGQVV